MRSAATVNDDTEVFMSSIRAEPVRVDTHEVRYLDLSGDGVPDAVEHVTSAAFRSRGSHVVDTIEEIRRLEYGIGIDGKPAGVAERTIVLVRGDDGSFLPVESQAAA